jgi:hypothetical protein
MAHGLGSDVVKRMHIGGEALVQSGIAILGAHL